MNEQVGNLDEGGLFGELLNGVPAVLQNALVTVDKADLRGLEAIERVL